MKLPYRWVHLDFHTSQYIPDIGSEFDAEEFAKTLKDSYVDAITVFAMCHHGVCYYPTKVGTGHPHLDFDLFGEMVKACKRHGIHVNGYITVVWNELAAKQHPEWRQISSDGKQVGKTPLGATGWPWICMSNQDYIDYLKEITKEIIDKYEVDGLFYDIVQQHHPGCVCNNCLKSMEEKNLDPTNEEDLLEHSLIVGRHFMEKISGYIQKVKPGITIYHNGRLRLHPNTKLGFRPELPYYSHIEIESLPSSIWGYNHFPLFVRYFRNLGKTTIGMTGKFHKGWGEFGGLKNQAALEFECFQSLANGAGCSIGDQLHPSGKLDDSVYKAIKKVYKSVAEKEPWCKDSKPLTEIAILLANPTSENCLDNTASEEGALQMLQESHYQFDVVDEESDFSKYKLIICPDNVEPTEKISNKMKSFIKNGGKVIASYKSLLDEETKEFAVDMKLKYEGDFEYKPSYILPDKDNFKEVDDYQYVMYEPAVKVKANGDSEVLAWIGKPYFNRTYKTFCSHQHTPFEKVTDVPAMLCTGNVVFISSAIFKAYRIHGNRIYKQMVIKALKTLIKDPIVEIDAPSTATVTVNCQEGRKIVHILHYVHQRRTPNIDIIEDVIPLHNINCKVKSSQPKSVYLAPQKTSIPFEYENGYAKFAVPEVLGHQMIVIEE